MMFMYQAMNILKCQSACTPVIRPVCRLVNDAVGRSGPVGQGGLSDFLAALPPLLCAFPLVLCFMSSMDFLNGICGSVVLSINAFVFPGIAYLHVCKPQGCKRLCAQGLTVFGSIFAV